MAKLKDSIKAAFVAALISSGMFAAYAFQPAKEQPVEQFYSNEYKVERTFCADYCTAKIKADDAQIYVEYKLDDASVESLEILNVTRFDEAVEADFDQYEIQKINAAIVGGVK